MQRFVKGGPKHPKCTLASLAHLPHEVFPIEALLFGHFGVAEAWKIDNVEGVRVGGLVGELVPKLDLLLFIQLVIDRKIVELLSFPRPL